MFWSLLYRENVIVSIVTWQRVIFCEVLSFTVLRGSYCEHCYMIERNIVRGSGLYSIEREFLWALLHDREKYVAWFWALLYREWVIVSIVTWQREICCEVPGFTLLRGSYCEHCHMTERNIVRYSGLYCIERDLLWALLHYREKYGARFGALLYREGVIVSIVTWQREIWCEVLGFMYREGFIVSIVTWQREILCEVPGFTV